MIQSTHPNATFVLRSYLSSDTDDAALAGQDFLDSLRPCEIGRFVRALTMWLDGESNHFTKLTLREQQVMDRVLDGQPSKNISADLGISQRTVENHRASIMRKTGCRSLPELARLALAASLSAPRPQSEAIMASTWPPSHPRRAVPSPAAE